MTSRMNMNRKWWRERVKRYSDQYPGPLVFAKVAKVGPGSNPEEVDHLMSAALYRAGERFYCFKDEASRGAFLRACPGATVCEDPLA